MIDLDQIRAVEARSFNAWPALQSVAVGGWIFRQSGGFTKRANSVNATRFAAPFAGIRTQAEAFYARHNLPAIFRLSPLAAPDVDRELAAAGYRLFDPSFVLVAPLSESDIGDDVDIEHAPSRAWLDGYAAANDVDHAKRSIHDRMVSSIAMPAGFATLRAEGRAIGFGLAVCERGAVGLFDIVIAPPERGRGQGRALTGALLRWGRRNGAQSAYLQVRARNEAARKLYAGLGFREAYRYHYRVPGPLVGAG
jgi:ribosomal protein S18 acetylase RimI-like enzyme